MHGFYFPLQARACKSPHFRSSVIARQPQRWCLLFGCTFLIKHASTVTVFNDKTILVTNAKVVKLIQKCVLGCPFVVTYPAFIFLSAMPLTNESKGTFSTEKNTYAWSQKQARRSTMLVVSIRVHIIDFIIRVLVQPCLYLKFRLSCWWRDRFGGWKSRVSAAWS